jgi:hypothetical protein
MEVLMSDVPGVSPSTLKADLRERLTAPLQYYRPLMLTGIPGVGKTAVVGQVCQELGIPFWTCRPIQHETVEYTGLPTVVDGKAEWAPFAQLLPPDPDWEGVIFVDEVTQLDTPSQKIVASLLDKEGVAGRRIPAGARFILAGNRQQDRAGASRMISIIESRCRQVELLFSLEDWQHWALDNGVDQTVVSFAGFKGCAFVAFDPSKTLNPLPRTWHAVSDELHCHPNASASKEDPVMCCAVQGLVGPGPAAEFLAFREHFHMLHNVVDQVFNAPQTVSLNADLSVQHALIGAISQRMKERNGQMTDQQLGNVVTFGRHNLWRSLQALLCLNCVASGCKRFLQVPETLAWCAEHRDTLESWRKGVLA